MVKDLGTGRRIYTDPGDERFPMTRILKAPPPPVQIKNWYANGAWFDQGNTGTCVSHSWAHWVEDGPVTAPGRMNPFELYREVVTLDEWSENDHESNASIGEMQFGSSVRAGAKALQRRGIVGAYHWAWDAETIVQALLTTGPVVVGSYWLDSMFDTTREGLIKPNWSDAATYGHAYVLNGVNLKRGTVRKKGSWGRDWGRKGFADMEIETLDRLVKMDGEACIATELRAA